jgi:hypothetical protein
MVLRNVAKWTKRSVCEFNKMILNVTELQHGSKGILKVREYR